MAATNATIIPITPAEMSVGRRLSVGGLVALGMSNHGPLTLSAYWSVPPQVHLTTMAVSMDISEPTATITLKLHWLVLPQASVATHVTVFVPGGNCEPEGGVQTRLTGPGQLSVAVTVKFTTAPLVSQAPATRSAGQLMTGGVLS